MWVFTGVGRVPVVRQGSQSAVLSDSTSHVPDRPRHQIGDFFLNEVPGQGAGDLGIGELPTGPSDGPAQNRIMIPPHDGCCPWKSCIPPPHTGQTALTISNPNRILLVSP